MLSQRTELLSDRLADGPLPIGEVLRFGTSLARALRDFHEHGSAHGHLDPACIQLTEAGVEILPVSKPAEISPYTAPEQIEGNQSDPRSDLFALGAVLYEMLAGRRAFDGDLRKAILEHEPEPLPDVPPALAQLVMKCLEKKPERRLQRAQLVAARLRLFKATNVVAPPRAAGKRSTVTVRTTVHPAPPRRKCPKCGAQDLRPSKARGALEEALGEFGVKFSRCYRCFNRSMRIGFLSFMRP